MKQRILKLQFVKTLLILLLVVPLISVAQEKITWDYPVKPGSEEWKKLKNNKQKVDACKIPEGILAQMQTTDLIEACLNYPLLRDVMAFNFLQGGINKLKENFGGFNELLIRDDAAKLLFVEYKMIKPNGFNKNSSLVQKGDYAFNIMAFEIFLSQKELLNTLCKSEKKELVQELLKKLEEKNDPEVYGRLSQMTIGLCIVRILEQDEQFVNIPTSITKDDLKLFSEKANLQSTQLLPSIIKMAEGYLK